MEDASRPMQNTRQAFLDAASLGVAFAECDVWSTSDGKVITWHDNTIGDGAADTTNKFATTPIDNCSWADLKDLKLKDGSTPVLLETVLTDLNKTGGTKLVIELKSSRPVAHIAEMLRNVTQPVTPSIAWIMSFSLNSLELFKATSEEHNLPILWLLDNSDYPACQLEDGELTFRYEVETLSEFLDRTGTRERFQRLKCGLYLQYRACLTEERLATLRKELVAEVPDGHHFIGLWTDADLDGDFDQVTRLRTWSDSSDAMNTDMRDSFWD
jgi:glycerophosphoryl diester phosphodiesterase